MIYVAVIASRTMRMTAVIEDEGDSYHHSYIGTNRQRVIEAASEDLSHYDDPNTYRILIGELTREARTTVALTEHEIVSPRGRPPIDSEETE